MNIDPTQQTLSALDPALGQILEGYLIALEQGRPPRREDFLAEHPEHAAALADYLPWIELLHETKQPAAGATSNPPMPGRLGDFRVIREIGRGGMGVVYEAEQISLQRRVALKMLPFASILDDRQLIRFKNEALAAAQLHHPNIVPVFAVGCERGLHFYVMQFIDGQTLEQLIQELRANEVTAVHGGSTVRLMDGKTNSDSATDQSRFRIVAELGSQAADALDHAHNQGIVHRDIKPSNLMIHHDGKLWVTDFGLARTQRDASMTASGELVGTLRYMSPEQLRSKPGIVDHRTDIYSLGATLYELVALRPAFEGRTTQELMREITDEDPPSLKRFDARVPRDLESIIFKAISKTPETRYASARDLADDLRRFLDGLPTLAKPPTWRDHCDKWIRRHSRLAASVAVLMTLGLACAIASAVLVWRANANTELALQASNEHRKNAVENLRDARRAVDNAFRLASSDLANVPGAEGVRRKLLTQALSYYQKFAIQASSDADVQSETATTNYMCGQINEQLGDDVAALAAYEEALRIWLTLQEHGSGDELSQSIALCENNIGLIKLRQGRATEAETLLRKAIAIQKNLATRRPDDRDAQRDLALSYVNLGVLLGQNDRGSEAIEILEKALESQQRFHPTNVQARGDLAATYTQLGLAQSSRSPEKAEVDYRHAAEEYTALAKEESDIPRWQAELATTLNSVAALATNNGRLEDAETTYRRAIDLQRLLVERAPQVVAYRRDLAVSRNNLGFVLCQRSRFDRAIEEYTLSKEAFAMLAQAHNQSPEYLVRLGGVCNNLGLAFEQSGANDQAEAAFQEAVAWQQQAIELAPNWPQAQRSLSIHQGNLTRLMTKLGRTSRPEASSKADGASQQHDASEPTTKKSDSK